MKKRHALPVYENKAKQSQFPAHQSRVSCALVTAAEAVAYDLDAFRVVISVGLEGNLAQ